jgi:hypothetical protein
VRVDSDELLRLPFVADTYGASGIYFMPRRESGQLIFGSVDRRFESEEVEDPDRCTHARTQHRQIPSLSLLSSLFSLLSLSGSVDGE